MEQKEISRNPYESPRAIVADVSPPLAPNTALSMWVRWMLYASIVVSVVAVASGFLERQVLADYSAGVYAEREADGVAAGEVSDNRQAIVGAAQVLVSVTSGILVLVWIRRANAKAKQLGAVGMQFTPGWSIGWYFIPIANLWKPYQAMREIWQASADPKHWQYETWPALLPWWWFLWVSSSFIGNAAFRLSLRSEGMDELLMSNALMLASDAIDIPLCVLFLAIVSRIDAIQSAAASATHQSAGFKPLG